MKWKRIGQGNIDVDLIDYLENIFEREMELGHSLKVCVGTDSQKVGRKYKFATAICIITSDQYGTGKGGMVLGARYFEPAGMTINERMIKEVAKSIEVSTEIWPLLDLYEIKLEIHADINQDERHASNKALGEAVGYIKGMDWEAKVKPNAYAASTVADNLC